MEIIYKIEFNSTNFYFKHIIDALIKETKVNIQTKMYKGFILLLCKEQIEKIENFFKSLEIKLPSSIFLSESKLIENFDFESNTELEEKDIKLNLSLLTNDEIIKIIAENNIDFSNDINKIKKGGISRFETHNGLKDFFLASKKKREDFEAKGFEVKLLITNINKLANLLEFTQKDIQNLCSVERPLVKLKFIASQNLENEYSNTRFIYAKIADDKETVLFSQALAKQEIDYLLYVNDDVYQDGLKVTYFENENIIISGEKALFPKYDYKLKRRVLSCKDYFEEYGCAYKAILAQYDKESVPSIGVYFSYKNENSAIKVNIPNYSKKDLIHIPDVFNNLENCLEDVKNIDENTKRLVPRYENEFKRYFENEFIIKDYKGFESILNLLSYIMGMKDYKEFEDEALLFNGINAVQIDMNIVKIDGKNYLDYRKIIQSVMSYKLAGVDNRTLAYSFYESLAYFTHAKILFINEELKAKDLILCGDMFSNLILLSKIKEAFDDINIILPKEYPLDYY